MPNEAVAELFGRIIELVNTCQGLLAGRDSHEAAAACCALDQIGAIADLSAQAYGRPAVLGSAADWLDVARLSHVVGL